METAGELVFDEQYGDLQEIASSYPWQLQRVGSDFAFIIGMTARDKSQYWLLVDCSDYPAKPPAWHWFNPDTNARNDPADTPKGGSGSYFHSSGRICAPWNQLSYKQVDTQGPHSDWELANWMCNPKTGGCTTLSAMALRISVELKSVGYQGRLR